MYPSSGLNLLLTSSSVLSLGLKMEAVCFFETLLRLYQTIRRCIQKTEVSIVWLHEPQAQQGN
jgi:hypothetical protein